MKRLFLAAMLLCGVYSAQAIKIVHGPYLQAVTDTEATVMWVTDVDALSWVEVAPDDGTHFYREARPKFYQTHLGKRLLGRVHAVRITGLKPGTKYRYAVASKEVLSQVKHNVHYGDVVATNVYRKGAEKITTLNPAKESVEFVVLNDIHSNEEKMEALLNTYDENTDLVFYNGDMVTRITDENTLFSGFIDTSVNRFATDVPFYMVRGNHETRGAFATNYMDYFPTTTNKPYYTLHHGNTFFIVLDGGEDKPDNHIEYYETADYDNYRKEVAEWLKGVVESEECKSAKYRVVLIHMPLVGGNKMWHGTKHAMESFLPILNKANITVMLSGHTHRYSYHTPNSIAEFPILVNAHDTALKANINSDGFKIDVIDMSGAVKHTHTFR